MALEGHRTGFRTASREQTESNRIEGTLGRVFAGADAEAADSGQTVMSQK